MDFTQATITKLDNGYVVALQGYSALDKQQIGQQYIAKDLPEAVGFLTGEKKTAPAIALHGVKKT